MIPLILFLLAGATIYLGSLELAFTMMMRLSLRLMAERSGRDDRLGRYLDDPLRLFVPVRLLIGVCVVSAAMIAAGIGQLSSVQRLGVFVLTVVAYVVIGEHLVPRLVVGRDPARALELLLSVFHPVARALRPLVEGLTGSGESRRERDADADTMASDEPAGMRPVGTEDESGLSDEEGRELLQAIVDFTETLVREVMTPRPDIVAIPETADLSQLRTVFREEQYSRIPVYRDDLDNIVGVALVKDLAPLPLDASPPLQALIRPAHFVPESKRAAELLKELQRRQVQLAIVVDEHGGTAGLVTVEDLLEEIVGEIRDEYDDESDTVTDEGQGVFVFSGKVSVDEVHDRLGVEIEREGFETVGGYLLSHLGRMPYLGETFQVDDLLVEVLDVERRRITKARVRLAPPSTAPRA